MKTLGDILERGRKVLKMFLTLPLFTGSFKMKWAAWRPLPLLRYSMDVGV